MTSQHWDDAYSQGDTTRGWYQAEARDSLRLMRDCGIPTSAAIIDIGGGASIFVDDLLDSGYTDLTVLDQSITGMDAARARLGAQAKEVTWIAADLLTWSPERVYDVWHDRAVLHFLLSDEERAAYQRTLHAATSIGSHAIIGVFGPDGPQMCAGLPVRRSTPEDMAALLGDSFDVRESYLADHVRPDGGVQQYLWTAARRVG